MSKHPIVHVEVPAIDPNTAGKFYSDIFGWKLELDQQFNYMQFQAEGGPGGAFVAVLDDPNLSVKPGDVLLYIATDDIDATLSQVEAQGGKTIVPKTDIPNVGWFGIFTDPTGNKIGLYTNLQQVS